jgi:hypothetical protein
MALPTLRLSVLQKGVKQGCPLSPLLLDLFLSDAGAVSNVR